MKITKPLMAIWLILVALGMMAPAEIHGQAATFPTQPQCTVILQATASTGTSSWINLSQPQCQDVHYWTLTWYALTGVGTIPTCTMKAEKAADTVTPSDLIANQTCTTTGTVTTSATAETNYVRINLGTKTGVGTVVGVLTGYRQNPFGSISASLTPSGTQDVNITQINGVAALAGNGVTGTGSPRVTIASNNTPFHTIIDTTSTTAVTQATGTNLHAVLDTTSTTAVTQATGSNLHAVLDAGSALIGETVPVTTATTTDTALTSYITSAASTNSTSVKGSAGNVYMLRAVNTTATIYFLRMYNSSSAPTCSSATGFVESIPIPSNSTSGAGFAFPQSMGQSYTTGIGYCLTGGGSSTDNTNAATGVYLTILYK